LGFRRLLVGVRPDGFADLSDIDFLISAIRLSDVRETQSC
jgi:hypothetical protein